MTDGAVIDLGRDWSIADDDRPAGRRWVRAWVVALVLVLTVVLTGGGEPVRPAFVALAGVPIAEGTVIALSPERVFLASRAESAGAGRTWHGVVAAYALPGGAPLWRTRLPQDVQRLQYAPGARVVFGATHDGGTGVVRTVALDAATGRLLWSSGSVGIAHVPAGGAQGLGFDRTAAGATVVRAVDLRTGWTLWSRPVPEGARVRLIPGAVVSDPFWVLVVKPDGAAELVAERTGAVLDARRLGSLRPRGGGGADRAQAMEPQVNMVGDRVLVLRPPDRRPATLTAYDLATLTPQWTVTGDVLGYPNACGPMICLADDDALTAVDPATGAVAWRTRGWRPVATFAPQWTLTGDFLGYPNVCGPMVCLPDDDALTAVDPTTGAVAWRTRGWQTGQMVDRDHLLVRPDQGATAMGLLDVRTGRVVMRMDGWTPVPDPATARTRLVVRADTKRPGRYWIATLDPAQAAPSPLGHLSGLASYRGCQIAGDLLACPTPRRSVHVWRLRP